MTQLEIDQRVRPLRRYCHGKIDRRDTPRAGALAALGIPALAMASSLLPQYAKAQTISFTDARIKASYVTYPSPGGNGDGGGHARLPRAASGQRPVAGGAGDPRKPGLNPYIEDVARRAAVAGFWRWLQMVWHRSAAIPGNDDDARTLQAKLDQAKLRTDMLNGAKWLKRTSFPPANSASPASAGAAAATSSRPTMGADLQATQPRALRRGCRTSAVPAIKAALLIRLPRTTLASMAWARP